MPTCHACRHYYSSHSRHCPHCYDDRGRPKLPSPVGEGAGGEGEPEYHLGQLVRCINTSLCVTGGQTLHQHVGRIIKKSRLGGRYTYLVQFDLGAYHIYGQDIAPALAQPETIIAIDNTGPHLTLHINHKHHRSHQFTDPTRASRQRLNTLLGDRQPQPIGNLLIYTLARFGTQSPSGNESGLNREQTGRGNHVA